MQLVDPNCMSMDFHRRSLQSVPGDQADRSDDAAGAWIRHGWEEQYTSEEYLSLLNSVSDPRWIVISVSNPVRMSSWW